MSLKAELVRRWNNTYYGWLCIYIALLVTLIFSFQMYRYFVAAPADEIKCSQQRSAAALVPVIGVLFDDI